MRGLLLATALVAVAFLYAWLDPEAGIRTWLHLRSDVTRAESRIAELRAEIAALDAEVEALRTDPFALERAIREELDWVRPGEILIRVPSSNGPASRIP